MNVFKCRSCGLRSVAVNGDICGVCEMRLRNAGPDQSNFRLQWMLFVVLTLLAVAVGFGVTVYMLSDHK